MLRNVYPAIFRYNEHARDQAVAAFAGALPSGARVLDAGAGPCKYKPLFARCRYSAQDFGRYTGSDHSYGELDYVCDITKIPVEDASFDAILCTEVLEHLPRPDLAIAEFGRILRPGGQLFVTAPLGSGIHMPPYHFYGGFSPYWYEHFLTESGLQILRCDANGGFFKLYGQESQRFLHLLTPAGKAARVFFLPIKIVLALWFRVTVPIVCHFLDRRDRKRDFTAGYFVHAMRTDGPTRRSVT